MIYSVYDDRRRLYDYYEDGRSSPTHASAPPAVATGKLGAVPEEATWRLPAAKKIGSGEMPRGRIAARASALGDVVNVSDPITAVIAVGIGYLAYRAWRKRR